MGRKNDLSKPKHVFSLKNTNGNLNSEDFYIYTWKPETLHISISKSGLANKKVEGWKKIAKYPEQVSEAYQILKDWHDVEYSEEYMREQLDIRYHQIKERIKEGLDKLNEALVAYKYTYNLDFLPDEYVTTRKRANRLLKKAEKEAHRKSFGLSSRQVLYGTAKDIQEAVNIRNTLTETAHDDLQVWYSISGILAAKIQKEDEDKDRQLKLMQCQTIAREIQVKLTEWRRFTEDVFVATRYLERKKEFKPGAYRKEIEGAEQLWNDYQKNELKDY